MKKGSRRQLLSLPSRPSLSLFLSNSRLLFLSMYLHVGFRLYICLRRLSEYVDFYPGCRSSSYVCFLLSLHVPAQEKERFLPIHLSTCPSIYLYVSISVLIYTYVYLSIYLYPSTYPSIFLHILSVSLSIYLPLISLSLISLEAYVFPSFLPFFFFFFSRTSFHAYLSLESNGVRLWRGLLQ